VEHDWTYQIGTAYPYFQGAGDAKRNARIAGETWWYWSRSPDSLVGHFVRNVSSTGVFLNYRRANAGYSGVRPALNLKSGILVSEINP
jgi:hypothetical protein